MWCKNKCHSRQISGQTDRQRLRGNRFKAASFASLYYIWIDNSSKIFTK